MQLVKNIEKTTRTAWLLGLGAFSKGLDLVIREYDKKRDDAQTLFNGLVAKGETVEADLEQRIATKQQLQDKVAKIRQQLGLDNNEKHNAIDTLVEKVERLTVNVSELEHTRAKVNTAKVEQQVAAAAPAVQAEAPVKKPAAPRKAAVSTKSVAKKPTTRKAVAKKTPTKSVTTDNQ